MGPAHYHAKGNTYTNDDQTQPKLAQNQHLILRKNLLTLIVAKSKYIGQLLTVIDFIFFAKDRILKCNSEPKWGKSKVLEQLQWRYQIRDIKILLKTYVAIWRLKFGISKTRYSTWYAKFVLQRTKKQKTFTHSDAKFSI